jgi:hypothetical protein
MQREYERERRTTENVVENGLGFSLGADVNAQPDNGRLALGNDEDKSAGVLGGADLVEDRKSAVPDIGLRRT